MTELLLHPGLILLFGVLLVPLLPQVVRKPFLLLVPTLAFVRVLLMKDGVYGIVEYADWQLTFLRVDALAQVFAHILALMAIVGTLYGLHQKHWGAHTSAWVYAGSSLGAIYAGDLLTLFVFWELMAVSSVFLIWLRGREQSTSNGYRYLLVHTVGGVLFLGGMVLHANTTGSWAFDPFNVEAMTPALWLIVTGFCLNAAVPPLHAWLPDAYGEASVPGAVFLCAFTTKTAVYALARGFAGLDILLVLGVIMTLYGVLYAMLENDSRRLLSYHIISQVGYMVAGVGIGTQLAINGVCAHAFAHILYKGLLFMGCGSVLFMTGQSRFSELGGLYKKMPWTFVFTFIGGLSISAFPFFSGFISKSIIVSASYKEHLEWAAFLLMLASVGTFLSVGLKLPYLIWFSKNRCAPETWQKARDPNWNMMAAMAVTAFLCIFAGSYTPYLYDQLPFASAEYHPYTAYHITETLSLLLFTALAFYFLRKKLKPHADISLDLDWFYRRGGQVLLRGIRGPGQRADTFVGELYRTAGLVPMMVGARVTSLFDKYIVDGAVNDLAGAFRQAGRKLLGAQRGAMQETLLVAVVVIALLLIAAILLAFSPSTIR